jgi:hypothetical protein
MTPLDAAAIVVLIGTFFLVAGLSLLLAFHAGDAGGLAPLAVAFALPLLALAAPLDLASASSPWRIGVALLCLSLALLGAYQERRERGRAFWACIVVVAWNAADTLAPFTWALRGPYIGALLCLGACFAVWFVLLAPERWLPWTRPGSR